MKQIIVLAAFMAALGCEARGAGRARLEATTNQHQAIVQPSEPDGRTASLSNLEVRVTLLVSNNTMTAGEPLLARVALVNRSDRAGRLSMGNSGGSTTCLEVLDANGKIIAATPKRRISVEDMSGLKEFAPGETYVQFWVISGLYDFRLPGDYTIRVQQFDDRQMLPDSGSLILMSEHTAALRVLPYDPARLKARCEDLFLPLRNSTSGQTDVPMSTRTKALYSVRDDLVLPYIEWMARQWDDAYACRAMRCIGTPKALALVNDLAARDDRAGRAAKRALAMDLETKDPLWDINWY
jgi:hypothetical protein